MSEQRMVTLTVNLGERSYPIHVGAGMLHAALDVVSAQKVRQVMVITNVRVAPLYLDALTSALSGCAVEHFVLPDGEETKDLGNLERIVSHLLGKRFARDCLLVALGGGVVGDITGFTAAVYQRGVRFLQVPTTLLAQVDSAVGGKTAVNHALGKNMIGAFHQPVGVVSDIDTLATLPQREFQAGLAEIIKYGLIRDADFYHWFRRNLRGILARDADALIHMIVRSCEIKADVVSRDEREGGLRAILNLGHTFGHAIETGLGYGVWLHGEAVAAGLCLAARMSCSMGRVSEDEVIELEGIVDACGLPTRPPAALSSESMLDMMGLDKKVSDGRLRLVLLERVGQAVVTSDFDRNMLTGILKTGRLDHAFH